MRLGSALPLMGAWPFFIGGLPLALLVVALLVVAFRVVAFSVFAIHLALDDPAK